jgi:hypothetical protein
MKNKYIRHNFLSDILHSIELNLLLCQKYQDKTNVNFFSSLYVFPYIGQKVSMHSLYPSVSLLLQDNGRVEYTVSPVKMQKLYLLCCMYAVKDFLY